MTSALIIGLPEYSGWRCTVVEIDGRRDVLSDGSVLVVARPPDD